MDQFISLTLDGNEAAFLRMESTPEQSQARWKELPPHFWGVFGKAKPGATVLQGDVAEALKVIDGLIAQVRRISVDLRPALLDEVGLAPALRTYLEGQATLGGLPIAVAAVVGVACWAGRVALAIPRKAKTEKVDLSELGTPWRAYVQDAMLAQARFEQAPALRRK